MGYRIVSDRPITRTQNKNGVTCLSKWFLKKKQATLLKKYLLKVTGEWTLKKARDEKARLDLLRKQRDDPRALKADAKREFDKQALVPTLVSRLTRFQVSRDDSSPSSPHLSDERSVGDIWRVDILTQKLRDRKRELWQCVPKFLEEILN